MKIFWKMLKWTALLVLSASFILFLVVFGSIPLSILEKPNDLLAVEPFPSRYIDHVSVVDVSSGRLLRERQLRIEDGRISEINPAGSATAPGVELIDGKGAFVSPGLWDMHVHLHDRKYLGVYLAHGVTSVRNMRGLPMHLRWKRELEGNEWLGSRLYTSSPVLDGPAHAHALQQVVTSPAEARDLVRKYHEDGYDLIKVYGYLEAEVYRAIIEESKRLNFPVAKHGPNPIDGLALSSNAGLQSLEHVEDIIQGALQFDFVEERLDRWIAELKTIDPVVTPTLATYAHLTRLSEGKGEFIDSLPRDRLNPLYQWISQENTVNRWLAADEGTIEWNRRVLAYLKVIVKRLNEQGVTLLVGSDAGTMYMPPGSSTHREIALMAEAGVSPSEVLRAATLNAAVAMGLERELGSVEVGKIADLVITRENPLDDLSTLEAPEAVLKGGQWVSPSELSALLESGEDPSSFYISFGRLLEDLISRKLSL